MNNTKEKKNTGILSRLFKKEKEEKIVLIEDAGLSPKAFNALRRAGVKTLNELTSYTRKDLLHVRNMGTTSLNEVLLAMAEHGLSISE